MLTDKIILITGATAGIGETTAAELARQGATLVLVSRNPARCDATVARLKTETGNQNISAIPADLTSMAQVRQAAERFKERHPRLDVLVNNAGANFMARQVSVDGYEMTFALNHLSYFLLTNLLLESLKVASSARIVNVSSGSHNGARLDFNDLQIEKGYKGMRAYGQSKLCNVLFTYELARRLGPKPTVNALHPGFVATRIGTNNGLLVRLGIGIAHLFALSPEEGAKTSIYLASSTDVEGVTGKYFYQCRPIPSDPASYDEESARRLWEVSAEMTNLSS
jgi:retinol dehydrogenase-12